MASESSTTPMELSSDDAVSHTMQKGLERIIVATGAGLLIGGLTGVVLARGGGGSGARKAFAGLGAGLGLGSSWTKVSMELEGLLDPK
jgi:high-affinity Fe2+/Pb2+ permease